MSNEFYSFFGFNENLYIETNSFNRKIITSGCFWLLGCLFSNIYNLNGNGGIYYIYNSSVKTLIDECMFFKCNSINGNGGVFFIIPINFITSTIINKVCGIDTKALSYSFSFIESSLNNFNKI